MAKELNIAFSDRMDRGLAYAESCFETFRIIDGEIFQWPAHWSRLTQGMAAFGLKLDDAQAEPVLAACLRHAASAGDDCLVRLTATGGAAEWGLLKHGEISFYIQATPFQPPSLQTKPLELISVASPFPLMPKVAKFPADYSLTLRSLPQWQQQYPKASAQQFLITGDGHLISGITANVLMLRRGQWFTPEGEGVLAGIVSQFLVGEGAVQAEPCPESWLDDCEAMVMTNCGQFMQLVQSVNGRKLPYELPQITALKHILKTQQGVRLEQD